MQPNKHRTWAEIDLGAIEHNYRVICEAAKAPVLCVVKADCYGHGAVPVANRLQSMGAPYFAVATVPEAVELRENGIEKPIIILGYIDAADMDTVAEYGITAPVYDEETAELLSAAAVRTGRDITVHYKLDTGMTRIGFPSWEREETVRRIFTVRVRKEQTIERKAVAKNAAANVGGAPVKKQPVKKAPKPGRNDPCPCGKMKADGSRRLKYKECCGRNE